MSNLDPNFIKADWRSEFKRLEGAYAPSTMRTYYTDVRLFVDWCEAHGLQPFPAEVQTVCRFLEAESETLVPSSIRRRFYAIRKAHRLLKLPDPTGDEDVNLVLRRIRRLKGERPKQAKGLTSPYLERFLDALPDSPWGLRDRAMISLGYDILARRSELVALRTENIEFRGDGTLRVLIHRSKTDQFGYGRTAFTSRRTALLMAEWLAWRGPYITPLFCPIYHGKAIDRDLSTTAVKIMIKTAAELAGLSSREVETFSGHSMRVGAAQDLLRRGHDTAAIMRAGGWKSLQVLGRYLEQAEHNVWT